MVHALFSLVFIPLGFILGVSAAALGFSAWAVVLPLLLVAFKLPVASALGLCLATDALNGILLTVRYRKHVDWAGGIIWGLTAAGGCVGGCGCGCGC